MASRYPRGDAVTAAPAGWDFSPFRLSHPHGRSVVKVLFRFPGSYSPAAHRVSSSTHFERTNRTFSN